MSDVLFRYLDVGAQYPEATAIHGYALQSARQAGDLVNEAEALNRLGSVAMRQCRYHQAVGYYEQAPAPGP